MPFRRDVAACASAERRKLLGVSSARMIESVLLSAILTTMPMIATVAAQAIAPATASERAPSDAAVHFAAGFSDEHLAGLLGNIGGRSELMAALFERHGEPVAVAFNAEIGEAVIKYRAAWKHNLALAWTPLLTDEELLSLSFTGAASPHLDKYLSLRTAAGETMQRLSSALLDEILAEVIQQTAAKFTGSE